MASREVEANTILKTLITYSLLVAVAARANMSSETRSRAEAALHVAAVDRLMAELRPEMGLR